MKSSSLSNGKETIQEGIKNCHLFSVLKPEQLEDVLQHSRVVCLEAGETLFQQKQEAKEFFLLAIGQMKLALLSNDGHEKIIDLVYPGHSFAEAIIFLSMPVYPVTATALIPSRIYCFNIENYAKVLHGSVDACFQIMAEMSIKMHHQVAEIDRLTLHKAIFRVACYLHESLDLESSEKSPSIHLKTPKHVIASRLSITPETLSRTLAKLTKEGIISVNKSNIKILQEDKLRAIVELI